MVTGTVKWFNSTKGYGFIEPHDGGGDIFVHLTAVQKAGLDTLNEGDRISYQIGSKNGKTFAEYLKRM